MRGIAGRFPRGGPPRVPGGEGEGGPARSNRRAVFPAERQTRRKRGGRGTGGATGGGSGVGEGRDHASAPVPFTSCKRGGDGEPSSPGHRSAPHHSPPSPPSTTPQWHRQNGGSVHALQTPFPGRGGTLTFASAARLRDEGGSGNQAWGWGQRRRGGRGGADLRGPAPNAERRALPGPRAFRQQR